MKKSKKMICFDMDGTIADLYNVTNWLPKLRAEDESPYLDAKPLWDMDELSIILKTLQQQGWEIRIITWLSKDCSKKYADKIRLAKLKWLEKQNFVYNNVHMVKYGTTKANTVRQYTNSAILIDDNDRVRQGWKLGNSINPTTENIIEKLAELLITK